MSDSGGDSPKKDLTGILELTSDPAAAGSSAVPDGATQSPMEETPIEKIEEFESLESFTAGQSASNDPLAGISGMLAPPTQPIEAPALETAEAAASPDVIAPIDQIKAYSERMTIGTPPVEAAYPFSLMIEGKLTADEREKLLDLLSTHQMGIREVDLEPQLESGRILIPRISEFAGVLLVQALRGAKVEMRLGPSDEIFASEATREVFDSFSSAPSGASAHSGDDPFHSSAHPAENLPLTQSFTLPGSAPYALIDVVTASATLETPAIEAESTSEYQEILEALQRELKYKAHRKGATAVLNFTIQLSHLSLPSRYRLTVSGTAVRGDGPAPLSDFERAATNSA